MGISDVQSSGSWIVVFNDNGKEESRMRYAQKLWMGKDTDVHF